MNLATPIISDHALGAFASYFPDFLDSEESMRMYEELEAHRSQFEAGWMLVGDRRVATPRLVAAFGDSEFSFPDLDETLPWTDALLSARDRLEKIAGHAFNYALVNWYRDGNDYTGWHSDKMQFHTRGTGVAIISLGVRRSLRFRPIGGCAITDTNLESGSLFLMKGTLQEHFEHSVPADPSIHGVRLSVTFRHLVDHMP